MRRIAFAPAALVAALGALTGTSIVGQSPSSSTQLPTFRGGVRIVEVDAVVTDKDGNFVTDLAKDDFEVLEDGRPQEVRTLSMVNLPFGRNEESRAVAVDAGASSASLGSPAALGRVYVMILDTGSNRVRTIARQFIDQFLGPDDLMAVVHVRNRAATQGLTANRELLIASIDRYQGGGGLCSGSEPSCPPFKTLKEVAVNLTAVAGRRKAILFFGQGANLWPHCHSVKCPPTDFIRQQWAEYSDAVRTAANNNIRIYPIHPEGFLVRFNDMTAQSLSPVGVVCQDGPPPSIDTCQYHSPGPAASGLEIDAPSALRLMAEDTGGIAIVNTGNYAGNFTKIVRDNSAYYMLSYVSPAERDGRFHRITVRVKNRPDLSIRRTRSGFIATAPDLKGRSVKMPKGLSASARALLESETAAATSPIEIFTSVFQADAYDGSVLVGAHVPGSSLKLGPNGKIELAYVAVDRWGTTRAAERRAFTLNLGAQTRSRVEQSGLRLFGRLRLPRGTYEIRVTASQENGLTGSATAQVEIPDFTDLPLSVSDLVVASSHGATLTTLEEDALLRRALPAQPTPNRRFGGNETLTVFGEIYDSHWILSQEVGVTNTVTADDGRLLFRGEQTLKTANRGRFYYTGRVPLSGFAPGAYTLTVEAHTRTGIPTSASQQMRFEVSGEER